MELSVAGGGSDTRVAGGLPAAEALVFLKPWKLFIESSRFCLGSGALVDG